MEAASNREARQPPGVADRRWLILAVSSAGSFLAFLDVTIVNIAFPEIAASFPATSLADLSWILNAYNIAFAALLVPAGRFADLLGRRRLFLAGLATFALASALCAAAPAPGLLVAARALQAIGAAVMVPASLALLLPAFPESERATAVGLAGAAAGLASGIGPSVGGLLVDVAGWRLVFAVNVPLGLAVYLAATRWLSESRDRDAWHPDLLGSALLASAVAALTLGIVKGPEWGWNSERIFAAGLVTLLLGAAFLHRNRRHTAPVLELSLFRLPSVAAANAGSFLFAVAFYGVILCNVLFLTSIWRYSVLEAGLAVSPAPLAAAIVAGPAGRLADRFGQRFVALPGVLVFAAGVASLAIVVGSEPAFTERWLPLALVYGVGIGLAFPALTSAAITTLPFARFATGSGVNATARQLGAVLGVAILIAAIGDPSAEDARERFREAWLLAVGVALTALVPVIHLARSSPPEREVGPVPSRSPRFTR